MLAALGLALVIGEQPIARGVVLRDSIGELEGEPQAIHELVLDLDDPALVLRVVEPGPNTCASVDEIAARAELVDGRPPVAAINFGFFSPWAPCLASSQVISLIQQDGHTLAQNFDAGPKGALGWTIEGEPMTTIISRAGDWPQARFALGGRGILIAEGRPLAPDRWRDDEGLAAEFAEARHPRTAIGVDADRGKALLITVDGRRASAAGMSLIELRERFSAAASEGLTIDAALNLDGGGSTTMWIAGRGIVNQPSDPGGPRAVVGALLIYAAPLEPELADPAPVHEPAIAEPGASGCRATRASPSVWLAIALGLLAIALGLRRRAQES
ncbi:phosphodiester glycosidase family protein [Nannocystaceae bacterium ST9]